MTSVSTLTNTGTQSTQVAQLSQVKSTDPAATNTAGNSNDSYGPATQVDLSTPAKAIVAQQNTSASQTDSSNSLDGSSSSSSGASTTSGSGGASTKKAAGGGAGGGSSTNSEVSSEVTEAKRKVAAQVGTAAANELVDKNGNIDKVGLAKEIAKQAQQKTLASGQSVGPA